MQIDELIKDVEKLLSLPDVVIRANELMDSGEANIEEIAEVVALDPGLSAQLLRLVNSAFYSFPTKIDTITRAITVIGVNELRSLLLSASAVSVFNRIAPEAIDMDDFWFRSVYVGLAAKQIAADRRKAEQMFLMGLLHDVGKIVLFNKNPDSANEMLSRHASTQQPLAVIEREILGFTLSQVSAALLQNWDLSESLWMPIQMMYEDNPPAAVAKDSRILQLAARLADCAIPEQNVESEAFQALQKDSNLLQAANVKADDLEDIMTEVNMFTFEVLGVINPDASLVF